MAFTPNDDLNIIQPSDSAIVGAGAGDDVYIVDGSTIGANQEITISDTEGLNTLRLTSGLSIVSSLVTSNATQLTLDNGAVVTLLGADSFSFELGGSGIVTSPVTQDFETFASDSLGVSVPAEGEAPATGGNVTVGEDGSTGATSAIVIPAGSTDAIAATADVDNFTFDLAAAQAETNDTQVDITGFDTAADKFTFDLATPIGVTTLDQLDGVEGIAVQSDSFAGSTLVTFGPDADGDLIAITIDGVTDAKTVVVDTGAGEEIVKTDISVTSDTTGVAGVAENFTYAIDSSSNSVLSQLSSDVTLSGFTVGEDSLTFVDVANGTTTTASFVDDVVVSSSSINNLTNIIFDENASGDSYQLVLTGIVDSDLSTVDMSVS